MRVHPLVGSAQCVSYACPGPALGPSDKVPGTERSYSRAVGFFRLLPNGQPAPLSEAAQSYTGISSSGTRTMQMWMNVRMEDGVR